MTLREKQSRFARMISELILWAYGQGYEITLGDAWSKPEYKAHRPNSLHFLRLAEDLNLFKDDKYLEETEGHRPLGEKWIQMGGSWGGSWGTDGNHYSLEHNGYR